MARFAQLTDLHLSPPGTLTQGTIDADRFVTDAITAILSRHSDVDAVLVTGDVADLGEEDAYARASMLLSRFTAPVIVVPGNHDKTQRFADAFSTFPGVGQSAVPGKVCHVHDIAGVRVVALDTSIDAIDDMRHEGELGQEQIRWLDRVLWEANGRPVLIAMHHPPFAVGIGFMDAIGLKDSKDFASVVSRHDNVERIVCGHVHRMIVSEVGGVPTVAVPGVAHQVAMALDDAEPALVMEPPAYALHMVASGHSVSHMAYVCDFGGPIRFSKRE